MAVAARVLQSFNRMGLSYRQLHHTRAGSLAVAIEAAHLCPSQVAHAEFVIDPRGVMMVILPFDHTLDLNSLNQRTRRCFQPLAPTQADRLYTDCEPGSHPPFASAYKLPAIVDEALLRHEEIYLQSGCHTTLLQVDVESFVTMNARAARMAVCRACDEDSLMSQPRSAEGVDINTLNMQKVADRLKRLYKLPPMPSVAARILSIVADPTSSTRDLARVIEQDPTLAAQVMRYARSALFGYRGEVKNVQDAVSKVLGFDRVCHIAMGIAAGRAFDIPRDGPLGLDEFWRYSLHTSFLAQQLATHVPKSLNVEPAMAYLCGLLHNFGLLLIGHLFRPEFVMLNKLAVANTETPLATLEKQVFGMGGAQELMGLGHGVVGSILLEHWNLPEEVCTVASMHHVEGYEGDHARYVHLVQLANSLLKDLSIGDDLCLDDPAPFMEALQLRPEVAYEIFRQAQEHAPEVQELARRMAA